MSTIIAAHDLSGVGRCSLTTALAALPAFGHTCYPLPTAVLSQQTGFSGYSFMDFTPHMPDFLNGWRDLGIKPDYIYTGFLGGGAQAELLSDFIKGHPDAFVLIDPVMGDAGSLYDCYDSAFVEDMRKLAKTAHILLPNATEFCLLAGRGGSDFPEGDGELLEIAAGIGGPNLKAVVITSAPGMCNMIVDISREIVLKIPFKSNGVSYNGAGDLFASVFCGLIANGNNITDAVKAAGEFVSRAVSLTPSGADQRYGIRYEPLLFELVKL